MKKLIVIALTVLFAFDLAAQGTEVTLDKTQFTISVFPLMAHL